MCILGVIVMEKAGVIYILTNPSFPEYVKIGYADDVQKRLAQLNSSECVPFSFRIYATYDVKDRLTDKKVHSLIDRLNPGLRAIENNNGKKHVREFYAMSAENAYKILEDIASINGLQHNLKRIAPTKDEENQAKEAGEIKRHYERKRKSLTFDEYGIPIGAELVYTKDPSIKCKVISNKKVEFEGKEYSLSALAGELNIRRGSKNKYVAGTDVFSYNGEVLSWELRTRLGI